MFKSDLEVESLLSSPKNHALALVKIIGSGNHDNQRVNGKSEARPLPLEDKVSAVIFSKFFGLNAASNIFGKAPSDIQRMGTREVVKEEVSKRIAPIQEKALDKVEAFLEMVGTDKELSDSLKAATVAEKAINIYERLAPRATPSNGPLQQIIFYAPKLKEADSYPVIELEG